MKKQPYPYLNNKFPLAIAHRGGASENPENSFAAFEAAYELGFRYMETDVHLSKDGEVVVFHDPDLVRLGERTDKISDLEWPQLKEIRLQSGESVLRLETLLKRMPAAKFNIDMKSDAVVGPLLDLIEQIGCQDRVCLASFYDHRIFKARQTLGPRLCTSAGRFSIGAHILRSQRLPIPKSKAAVLQVPQRKAGVEIVTQEFVHHAHKDGKHVHVWTVDDASAINWLLDLGVDGIMTDRPRVLKQVLLSRGQWHS